ncbi:DUF3343 domain-containing protein [Endozoicomonas montiporae]|uniref:Putative Se/S carrier protein-like domain-containing protein n=1 Tax=Endozoicomonas montiporae CL-33 TaxID=570277 RepID=A0A142B863_9GAMM|nr:DUF3343 domain-containing protein [Endozoicomonas montiporae]AMO54939.1 hypothetical protein EZMO1_0702 [Endozoicomonas montiporae CL-33]
MKRAFILLNNMRSAIKAEAWCREQSIACEVIPVPRQLSSECGMCLEIDSERADHVQKQLLAAGFSLTLAYL